MSRFAFRAGWPDRVRRPRKIGLGWVYLGPWVLGATGRWDRAGR